MVQSILIQSGKCKLFYVSAFVVVAAILNFNILFYYFVYHGLHVSFYLFLLFV